MSDTGQIGELLRSRIMQCDALAHEVEKWKRRHARALGVAEGNARRVVELEHAIASHQAYLDSMADGENDYTDAAKQLAGSMTYPPTRFRDAQAKAWDLGYLASALGITDKDGDPNPYREVGV